MSVGLGFQSDKSPETYAALARRAEEGGVDVVTVYGDLGFQPPFFPLLIMAQATERVRLGPSCLNPFGSAPHEIAGQVAALDLVSDGRTYLGIARGAWLERVGIDQPRPVQTIREAIEVVRRLLRGDDEGFEGEIFRLAPGTRLRYAVRRTKVPVLLGTWGPRTAALAGEVADEVKLGGSANPALVGVMRERVAVGTDRVGRGADDVGIVLGAVTVVDEDGRAARNRARTEVAMYLDVVADLDPTVELPPGLIGEVRNRLQAGDGWAAGQLVPDEVLDRFAFAGTPSEVADHAAAILDAGAARVEFGTPHGLTDQRGVGLLVDRVLPALR